MKKTAAALAAALVMALSGCSGRIGTAGGYAPAESGIYVAKDGTLSSAFVETYEKDYYDEESLRTFLEESLSSQYGDLGVTLKECSVENGTMKAVFDHTSPENMVAFLEEQKGDNLDISGFQVDSVEEGMLDGRVADGVFLDAAKKTPAVFSDVTKVDGMLITVEGTATIQTEGKILYVSEGVEAADRTAVVSGGTSYLIVK